MKSFSIVALLCISLAISSVTSQIVDDKLTRFFEYMRPFWRRHRARLVPFVNIYPPPLWRLARSTSNVESPEEAEEIENVAACIYSDSKLFCTRKDESVECDVNKKLMNPLLQKEFVFAVTPKKEKKASVKFNLLPKSSTNKNIHAVDLKKTIETNDQYTVVSIHANDLSEDEGLTITDDKCWFKMFQLLNSAPGKMIEVEKVNKDNEMWNDKEPIIANLLVLP